MVQRNADDVGESMNILTKEMILNAPWRCGSGFISAGPGVMISSLNDTNQGQIVIIKVGFVTIEVMLDKPETWEDIVNTNMQSVIEREVENIMHGDWFKERYNMEINL